MHPDCGDLAASKMVNDDTIITVETCLLRKFNIWYNAGPKKMLQEKPCFSGALLSGPDRDRTGDLYTASVALSQLSYGPFHVGGYQPIE